MSSDFYESDSALEQYLLFHYGTPEQICPLIPEARSACGFPVRCVTEPLHHIELRHRARALDLGCAVGRSSLELARHFDEVTGVDFSKSFVQAAQRMAKERSAKIRVPREGAAMDEVHLQLPPELKAEGLRFEVGDACALREDIGVFDFVLMANLIDRLPDPAACLKRLPSLVSPGGWVVITSPYTWLEEYTPREKWLTAEGGTLAALKAAMSGGFDFVHALDLPFLIREHRRKYQWSVAELSIWRRVDRTNRTLRMPGILS